MKMTPAQVSVALASALGQMENAILKSGGADTTGLMTAWSAVKEQLRAPLDALADVLENLPHAQGMHFDLGIEAAHAGTLAVSAGYEDLPFDGCPDAWAEKPFARICWFHSGGDTAVGIPAMSGWTLAPDQSGTVVADLAERAQEDAHQLTPAQVLADRSASRWLLAAIRDGLERDPVDVANDAQVLAGVFRRRADSVLAAARQSVGIGLPGAQG